MTTEGWICPICHAGVAPSCVRCPCKVEVAGRPTPGSWDHIKWVTDELRKKNMPDPLSQVAQPFRPSIDPDLNSSAYADKKAVTAAIGRRILRDAINRPPIPDQR